MKLASAFPYLLHDFPGGLEGRESICNAGDAGWFPGLGRFPGEGNSYPSVFLPGESQGHRSLAGYSPWSHRVGHNSVIKYACDLLWVNHYQQSWTSRDLKSACLPFLHVQSSFPCSNNSVTNMRSNLSLWERMWGTCAGELKPSSISNPKPACQQTQN